MKHVIDLYERTIVFVQRMKNQGVESFSKYADLDTIVQNKLISFSDMDSDQIDFGELNNLLARQVVFRNLNIRLVGHVDRLVISMEDAKGSDKYFYDIAKKLSDVLVKEDIAAIGINYNGIIETKKADKIIKEKFINECTPDFIKEADTGAFKLVYQDEDKKAVYFIAIDSGAIRSEEERREGILISTNFHREIKTQNLMKMKMDEFQDSLEKVKVKFEDHKKKIESYLNG